MNIAILQYNNYFNRTIRKAGIDAASYFEAAYRYQTFQNYLNLKPNDEITTSIILNSIDFHPDYLIQYDDVGYVVSRWFVLEIVQKRGEQHELTIRRDVVTDNLDAVMTSKAVIERGSLYGDSPLLLNNENFSFNQIKKGEVLLKDESGTAWIVGYMASNLADESDITASTESAQVYETVESLGLKFNDDLDPSAGATMDSLSTAYAYCAVKTTAFDTGYFVKSALTSISATTDPATGIVDVGEWTVERNVYNEDKEALFKSMFGVNSYDSGGTIRSQIVSDYGYASAAQMDKIRSLNYQVVYSSVTQKYYQLKIVSQTSEFERKKVTLESSAPLFQSLKNIVALSIDYAGAALNWLNPAVYFVGVDLTRITVQLVEVAANGQIKTHIPNSRNKLIDGPYDMFAMPFTSDNLALAQAIKVALSTNIYDIQILPYCPYREFIDDPSGGTSGVDYELIKEYDDDLNDWVTVGYILFPISCSASFVVNERVAADSFMDDAVENSPIGTKILNETQKFRLCAPNYNSAFDISVMKNGGVVESWRVDFTYRPISPYIHVGPMFSGLYGLYNNDARGLILSGDFSIDVVSNEWMTYQVQNKNYQNIFNTQIKTMDELHELDVLQKGLTVGAGSIVSGIAAGAKTGNAWVAAGAAAMTAGAGIFDIAMNQERFNINRRQALEMFQYQIGNIKALPNTLTKISAYNVNNKYFPLVEVYGATSQEIEAFREFLVLRGFSVNVCGTLFDYVNYFSTSKPFIKARIIRIDQFRGDSHMAEEIYKEFEEGVYIDEI